MKPSRKRAAKSVNTHGSPLCFLNARTGDAGGSRIVALRVQNEFYRYTPQYPQVCMYGSSASSSNRPERRHGVRSSRRRTEVTDLALK